MNKFELENGDRIALEFASADVDTPDSVIWMRVVEKLNDGANTEYVVAYPDGELRRGTIRAEFIGRCKSAAQFARDEYDLELANNIWRDLSVKTAGHSAFCDCEDCVGLFALIPAVNYHSRLLDEARRNERQAA